MSSSRIAYHGISGSQCGYCGSEEDSFVTEAFSVGRVTAGDYQHLIDMTWRRSGHLLYRPIYPEICCKPYTIRLDVGGFAVSKSQKKTLRRFLRHVASIEPSEGCDVIDWVSERMEGGSLSERLRLSLEPAAFDEEAYELYQRYQVHRHGDDPQDLSPSRYEGFLVLSPIAQEGHLGSFHHKWYLDNKLIAVGVLDILPHSVSSVYFFHDPELSKWSLGTVSAMIEIALVRYLARANPELHYYYMGYYIEDCSKMRYKGEFGPAEVLNPEIMQWLPFEEAKATIMASPPPIN